MFGACIIDSRGVKLILTCLVVLKWSWFCLRIDSNLKLVFVAFESKHDFYTEIHGSTHFYINVSKHKPLYNMC